MVNSNKNNIGKHNIDKHNIDKNIGGNTNKSNNASSFANKRDASIINVNKKNKKEYVGITGFKTLDEITQLTNVFENTLGDNYLGMYGFLIMDSQVYNPAIQGRRMPSLNNLKKLTEAVPDNMMPTLHYCSKSRNLDLDNLSKILDYDKLYDSCKFLQINLDWPEVNKLEKLKGRFPELYIIQQLNPNHKDTGMMLDAIGQYSAVVDKLLIDPSLGAGLSYSAHQSANLVNMINNKHKDFSYVICGGLDELTVYSRIKEMKSLIDVDFSVDAEGRLRNHDLLDLSKCKTYIENSVRALID